MRRLLVILIVLVLFVVLIIISSVHIVNLSDKIVKFIDNNCDGDNICTLKMNEITDFKWDKMLIYQVGTSRKSISEALGVEYKDSVDLMSGIVFVYENKIVYKERIPYNPERPNKLNWYARNEFGEPSYRVFTRNNAIFEGSKKETDGVVYYKIEPLKNNQ